MTLQCANTHSDICRRNWRTHFCSRFTCVLAVATFGHLASFLSSYILTLFQCSGFIRFWNHPDSVVISKWPPGINGTCPHSIKSPQVNLIGKTPVYVFVCGFRLRLNEKNFYSWRIAQLYHPNFLRKLEPGHSLIVLIIITHFFYWFYPVLGRDFNLLLLSYFSTIVDRREYRTSFTKCQWSWFPLPVQ